MNKRKTFSKVFSEKILISIPILLIIIIITFNALHQYSKSKLTEVMNFSTRSYLSKILEGEGAASEEQNWNFLKFRINLNLESILAQYPGIKGYIYVSDSDGNLIMDTSPAWMYLHPVRDDDYNLLERVVYICDYETLCRFECAREIINRYNKVYDSSFLGYFIPNKKTYENIEITEGFVDPETLKIYPTTIEITTERIPTWMGAYDETGDFVTDVQTVSMPLEEKDGWVTFKYDTDTYTFYIDGEEMNGLHLLCGRNLSLDDYQAIARRPLSNRLTNTEYYTDPSGKEYVLTTKITDDFLRRFLSFFILLSMIYVLIDVIVCFLLSNLSYSKLKVWYQNEDYRKALMNSMAHDLKTPLTVMSGYAENLKENVQSEKREHYADAIMENTEYMNGIIADVLALSKIESSTDPSSTSKIDLCELSKEVIVRYEETLKDKCITYTIDGSFNRNSNQEALKRVMDNLINNAAKYTKENGTIKIYAKDKHCLVIQNTPIAPLKTNPSKLWDPFVKDDESRSEKNGTGLGLSIVRSLLQSQGLKAKIISKGDDFKIIIK